MQRSAHTVQRLASLRVLLCMLRVLCRPPEAYLSVGPAASQGEHLVGVHVCVLGGDGLCVCVCMCVCKTM